VITRDKTMKQMTLAATRGFEKHNRATRKAEFLARLDRLMPWAEFCAVIEPHYPKSGNGRPPVGLERMLRMYCIANWFNLADEACEDALYDVHVFREFCRIDLGRERVPDATILLHFRQLLKRHGLGAAMLVKIGELLLANGMKLHIGTDSQTGLVHSASVTAANVHDSHQVPNLLHGEETRFYGDSAYRGKEQRERLKIIAPKAKDFTNKRANRNSPLTDADKETNRRKSSVRSKVEHPFLTLKRLWGFAKVRYRGLAKNANRAFAVLAMLNVAKWERPLTGEVRPA
jgi:IS5 family transposase